MSPEISPAAVMAWTVRLRAIASKSNVGDAEHWGIANRAPPEALRVFKAAVGGGMTSSDMAVTEIGGFTDTLRTKSVFFRILSDSGFTRVPLRTRVGIATVPATGAVVPEGAAVGLSKLTLTNFVLEPMKAAALTVISDELLRDVSAAGQQLFARELQSAVGDAVDTAFLTEAITGATSIAATATTAVAAQKDFRSALLAVNTVGNARLYWIAAPNVAKMLSTLADASGVPTCVAASPMGGELTNIPLLVASGFPAGQLLLLDASGVAADGGPVDFRVSRQGSIEMANPALSNTTTPTGGSLVSMFQTNSAALLCSAVFGAQQLRTNCCALITGCNYGA
jgi:hypothetical protein